METPEVRYDELQSRMLALYRQGRQREVLELVEQVDPELAPWKAEIAHFEACMHGSLGDADSALAALQRATAEGAWWDESLLLEDDDLAVLRGRPELDELVELVRGRKQNGTASWIVERPADGVPVSGVVIALHGAGQHAGKAARDWAPVVGLGYALVAIDSSQLISPKFRNWHDRAVTVRDIAAAVAGLPDDLRGLPVVAAGFSNGGRAALEWALTADPVAVDGVILLAPSLRELPEPSSGPLSPATILVGTEDHALAGIDRLADQLTGLGFQITRIPGLGHTPPPDFPARLTTILTQPNNSK